jgi:lipoate-protein ligase A
LRSPAKNHIRALGVESVSSPVGNIGLNVMPFQQRLQEEFADMYASVGTANIVAMVGDEHLNIPEIRKGYDEMRVRSRCCFRDAVLTVTDRRLDVVADPTV